MISSSTQTLSSEELCQRGFPSTSRTCATTSAERTDLCRPSLNHGNKVERTIYWFKHHRDPPRRGPPPVASLVMRVALVCPYSFTVPGGVQTQVLGLARALGARGDIVAVIGPADGVGIPAGLDADALERGRVLQGRRWNSDLGERLARPVSPWPATMARTRAALRRFAPSVVHIHEPFVPGPSLAAVWFGPRPDRGNLPPCRGRRRLSGVWARRRRLGRATRRRLRRLRGGPRHGSGLHRHA